MSFQSKFLKFMASPRGREVTFGVSVSAAVLGFSINFLPHGFCQYKYREFIANYHQGTERPVTDKLKEKVELVINLLNLPDFERKFVDSFMVTGFDIQHLGSLRLRFGANVGLPINYTYTSESDIDKGAVIVRGEPVNWSSNGGELLKEALVLKDDEQIFAIAREVLYMKEKNLILHSCFPTATIFMYYLMTHNINSKLHMFHRPLSFRIGLYGICGFLTYGLYALATDFLEVYTEGKVDEKLCTFGERFIDAGIRFHDKLLKKNIAIRELTGDTSVYTALGNENYMIRNKTIPLFLRKRFFELKKSELAAKKEESIVLKSSDDVQIQQHQNIA